MANAYTATLGSLSVTPPPGVPNPYMATEPNIDNPAVMSAGAMGTTFSSNEKKIVMSYLAMPWADGHHTQFKHGDIVFISRHKEDMRFNIIELNKINQTLRLGWDLYDSTFGVRISTVDSDNDSMDDDEDLSQRNTLFNLDHDSGDVRQSALLDIKKRYLQYIRTAKKAGILPSAEAIFFEKSRLKRLIPESVEKASALPHELSLSDQAEVSLRELKASPEYKNASADGKAFLESLVLPTSMDEQLAYNELFRLLIEQRDSSARYATNFGISRHWNLLGIVNNTAEGKGMQGLANMASGIGNATVVNVVLENRTRTFNRWGDVKENSHLYLVETRRRLNPGSSWEDSKWGEYQIVPWFTNANEKPPHSLTLHKDLNGHDTIGRDWDLGKVDRRTDTESALNIRLKACGLATGESDDFPSLPEAFNAKAKLDMLEIFFNAL